MNAPDTIASRLIGSLFVDRGLVSESQIRVALEIQRETGEQLGQILVQRFGVSRKELARVVAEQWKEMGRGTSDPQSAPSESWRPLGEIFITRGFISEEELDGALKRQRKTGERLGEALVGLGVISKFELAGALAEQMASLGEPDDEAADEQHATVHQLPDRPNVDGELPYGALAEETTAVELVQEHEAPAANGDGFGRESTAVETQFEVPAAEPVLVETPFEAPPVDVVAEAAAPILEPVDAPETDVAAPFELQAPVELWPEQVYEPPAETWPEPAAEAPVEVAAEATVEAFAEPELDPSAEPEQARVDEDLHDRHPEPGDTLSVGSWHLLVSAPESGLGVSVAFAPTGAGYRLIPLPDVPTVGETVDVPGVGAQVVLRLGRSPLPGDIRVCVYVEDPFAPGGQADSAA